MIAERYTATARTLHWVMALLIIVNLIIGLAHDALPEGFPAIPLHKSIGLTVLALTLVRIGWRIAHRPPPLPAGMPLYEKLVANVTHIILYAFMLLLPMSGWIMSSAGKYPLNWFGLFAVPKFDVTREDPIVALSREGHEIMGLAWAALLILHAAAALRHHFVLKDNILWRMLR